MLFFGIASFLMGFIQFSTPGIEGGSSNMIEVPLSISTFYLSNPLYLIGVSLIMSFVTPAEGSYWSTFLMHVFPLIISWYVVRFIRERITHNFSLGVFWGIYMLIHYCLLLLPLLILTNHLFGLNTELSFFELYSQILPQITFEMASTVLTTSIFLVLMKAYEELKQHKNDLEELVTKRTQDLKESNFELEKIIATKDKLFRIIGHDLRTPIGQIIQITELLEDGYKDMPEEEFEELTGLLKESSDQGMQLLENLLKWARTQTGSLQLKPQTFELSPLVEEAIGLLKKSAKLKEIQIQNQIPSDILIFSDKNILQTVLRNLISNAIKFTPQAGEISVFASLENHKTIIGVQDNGVGIPQQDLPKLFDIEANFSTQGTNEERGTGIGLVLCKELIEHLNGEISVESQEGEGSTFLIKLPSVPLP